MSLNVCCFIFGTAFFVVPLFYHIYPYMDSPD
jgi:hypothetical protein